MKVQIFDEVHALLRRKNYSKVLEVLIDSKTGRVKYGFSTYRNHAWYLVGDIYLKLRNYGMAASAFTKSLNANPFDADAALALGYCYSENGQPRKAKNVLAKAAQNVPRDARIKYNLANAYFDLNQKQQAHEIYLSLRRTSNQEVRGLAKLNAAKTKLSLMG